MDWKKQTIKPKKWCSYCHGRGYVTDWVDYGSTTVPMETSCECVEDQADEDADEIAVDASEYEESERKLDAIIAEAERVVEQNQSMGLFDRDFPEYVRALEYFL